MLCSKRNILNYLSDKHRVAKYKLTRSIRLAFGEPPSCAKARKANAIIYLIEPSPQSVGGGTVNEENGGLGQVIE